jgi:hypothetical protein
MSFMCKLLPAMYAPGKFCLLETWWCGVPSRLHQTRAQRLQPPVSLAAGLSRVAGCGWVAGWSLCMRPAMG